MFTWGGFQKRAFPIQSSAHFPKPVIFVVSKTIGTEAEEQICAKNNLLILPQEDEPLKAAPSQHVPDGEVSFRHNQP